jgi:hypothetical protein
MKAVSRAVVSRAVVSRAVVSRAVVSRLPRGDWFLFFSELVWTDVMYYMQGAHDSLARACMEAIDRDRTLLAVEAGYIAAVTTMAPFVDVALPTEGGSGGGSAVSVDESGLKNQLVLGWTPAQPGAGE